MRQTLTDGPGLRLRPATPEDAPAMASVFSRSILVRARGAYGPRELSAWAGRGTAGRFAAMLADPAKAVLVAELDGALVGLAGLDGTEVSLLYAAPEAPPGTGRALLGAVEDLARRRGIEAVRLTASRNAVSFYLRSSYDLVAMAVRPLPEGVSLPVCLMAKALGPSINDGTGAAHDP